MAYESEPDRGRAAVAESSKEATSGTAALQPPSSAQYLTELTAVEATALMKSGSIKAEVYAGALLDQAQRLSNLNAFRTLDRGKVLESAQAADKARAAGAPVGILHGLPVPVKDSVNTKSLSTSNGTQALRDFQPADDAAVLKSLWAQGAVLMGKTNLHELSYGWTSNNSAFGAVRNPYSGARVPGGSSGGSAAAVAARMAPLAVAEDTLGSIRIPAAMCGLVGLRPSFGRYPNDGVMTLSDNKFDQVGCVARCVGDLALFDAAVTGDTAPLAAAPLAGMRIGVDPEYFSGGLDPAVERITAEALRKLTAAGVVLVPAPIPELAKAAMTVTNTILAYETASSITKFLQAQGSKVTFDQVLQEASAATHGALKALALPPNQPAKSEYESMLAQRQQISQEIRRHFELQGIIALALPPILTLPPRIGEDLAVLIRGKKIPLYVAMARNTALATCASLAGLVLPAGMTANGLPVGVEFDAPTGNDRLLLSLGLSMERALGQTPAPKL